MSIHLSSNFFSSKHCSKVLLLLFFFILFAPIQSPDSVKGQTLNGDGSFRLDLDLPAYQLPYLLRSHRPQILHHCSLDSNHPICRIVNSSRHVRCWGYENTPDCKLTHNTYHVKPSKFVGGDKLVFY